MSSKVPLDGGDSDPTKFSWQIVHENVSIPTKRRSERLQEPKIRPTPHLRPVALRLEPCLTMMLRRSAQAKSGNGFQWVSVLTIDTKFPYTGWKPISGKRCRESPCLCRSNNLHMDRLINHPDVLFVSKADSTVQSNILSEGQSRSEICSSKETTRHLDEQNRPCHRTGISGARCSCRHRRSDPESILSMQRRACSRHSVLRTFIPREPSLKKIMEFLTGRIYTDPSLPELTPDDRLDLCL